jgi:hypothetical protein
MPPLRGILITRTLNFMFCCSGILKTKMVFPFRIWNIHLIFQNRRHVLIVYIPDMGWITLKSNALHYFKNLALALPLLCFLKVMYYIYIYLGQVMHYIYIYLGQVMHYHYHYILGLEKKNNHHPPPPKKNRDLSYTLTL